jgi:phosphatidylinositol dimannoside acyltransferase
VGESTESSSWRATTKYLVYRGLGTVMGYAPEGMAQRIAVAAAGAMAWRGGDALAMNERHMTRVLGSECVDGVEPDAALVKRWSRRTYTAYARYWVDGARLPYVPEPEIRARMWIERGEANLRASFAEGKGVILALPHAGSWEWGGAWLALEEMPMTAVVERVEPPQLFEWFLSQRAGMGLTGVPLGEDSGSTVLRALKDGKLVGLVCDRDLVGNGVEVEFFGEKTTLPGGAATLALRTGAALLPTVVYGGPENWHTGVVGPPVDLTRSGSLRADVARITQELASAFEGFIRRQPEQWHLYQPNWPSDRS